MRNRFGVAMPVVCALALTLLGGATGFAQTQSTETRAFKFDVISVDGNDVVYRDDDGTHSVTVPDDFKFMVDGKPVSVHELAPGTRGTAMVTKTTTVTPVYVTEVKKGTVVRVVGSSVYVRGPEGIKGFTRSELDKRGVKILMNGKPVKLTDLHAGDELTATIVSWAPPKVTTAQEVQAALDVPEPAPAPADVQADAPASAASEPASAASEPAAAAAEPAAAAATPAPAADAATKPEEPPADRKLVWIIVGVVVVIGAFLLMRRKKPAA